MHEEGTILASEGIKRKLVASPTNAVWSLLCSLATTVENLSPCAPSLAGITLGLLLAIGLLALAVLILTTGEATFIASATFVAPPTACILVIHLIIKTESAEPSAPAYCISKCCSTGPCYRCR